VVGKPEGAHMKFWTRMLIMVVVLNTILMISLPLLRPSASMPDQTGGMIAPNMTQGDLTQPGVGIPNASITQSVGVGGISLENPLFGLTAAISLVVNFVITVAMFANAPVEFANALSFPGIITLIIMAVYYPALVIGFIGAVSGRET
jgi:hypothetical protein